MSIQRHDNNIVRSSQDNVCKNTEEVCSARSAESKNTNKFGFFSRIASFFSGKSISTNTATNTATKTSQVSVRAKQANKVIDKLKAKISTLDSGMRNKPSSAVKLLNSEKEALQHQIQTIEAIALNEEMALSNFSKSLSDFSPENPSSFKNFIDIDIATINEAYPELITKQREAILDELSSKNISPEKRDYLNMLLDIYNIATTKDVVVIKSSIDNLSSTISRMALSATNDVSATLLRTIEDIDKGLSPQEIAQKMKCSINTDPIKFNQKMDIFSKIAGVANEACNKNANTSQLSFDPAIILANKLGRTESLSNAMYSRYNAFIETPSVENLSKLFHSNLERSTMLSSVATTAQADALAAFEGKKIDSVSGKTVEAYVINNPNTTVFNNLKSAYEGFKTQQDGINNLIDDYKNTLSANATTSALVNTNSTIDDFANKDSFAFLGLKTLDKSLLKSEKRTIDEFLLNNQNINDEQKSKIQVIGSLYNIALAEKADDQVKGLDDIRTDVNNFCMSTYEKLDNNHTWLSTAEENNKFLDSCIKTIQASVLNNDVGDLKFGKPTVALTFQSMSRSRMIYNNIVAVQSNAKIAEDSKKQKIAVLKKELNAYLSQRQVAEELIKINVDIIKYSNDVDAKELANLNDGSLSSKQNLTRSIQQIHFIKANRELSEQESTMFNNHLDQLMAIRTRIDKGEFKV